MKTIAIVNSQGGVGKTTTAYAMCVALAARGFRVVGIDLDPQASFTELSTISSNTDHTSIADLLAKDIPVDRFCVLPTKENYSIIPGSHLLYKHPVDQLALSRIIKNLSTDPVKFDFCIIDTPPMASPDCIAALSITDKVIIPTEISISSLYRLLPLVEIMESIQHRNPDFAVDGLLITKSLLDKLNPEQRRSLQEIANQFRSNVYDTIIPEDLNVVEASFHKKNFLRAYPESPATEGYFDFVDEFLLRNTDV